MIFQPGSGGSNGSDGGLKIVGSGTVYINVGSTQQIQLNEKCSIVFLFPSTYSSTNVIGMCVPGLTGVARVSDDVYAAFTTINEGNGITITSYGAGDSYYYLALG